MTAQPRAAIYCRVSTLEQSKEGYSLEAQEQDCKRLAADIGATVITVLRDTDKGDLWDLPGLNALLDGAKRRDFDLVLCYDPDRLARRLAKQLVIEEELKRAGVALRYVTLRVDDNAEGQLLKNVRSSIAEYEKAKIALRTSRGRRAKAERGLVVGTGMAPYGYRYTRDGTGRVAGLEPDPNTAPVVRRIFVELAQYGLNEVCRRLTADGVPTYYGRPQGWANTTILHIINNPVYLGTAAYGRRDTHKQPRDRSEWLLSAVPPLIDHATWEATHEAMTRRKRHCRPRDPEAHDPYLLRGLLTCAHCGGALACQPSSGVRYYVCLRTWTAHARLQGKPRCDLPPLPAVPLEEHIWQLTAATLLDPEHLAEGLEAARTQHIEVDARRRDRITTIDREIDRLRARLQRITAERLDTEPGSESERALKTLATETEDTIRRLRADRAELDAQPTQGLSETEIETLEQFAAEVSIGLEHATPAEQRQVYELLRLRGKVRRDAEKGVKLGRRHCFSIDWAAIVQLLHGVTDNKKVRLRFYTDDYVRWEIENLGETTQTSWAHLVEGKTPAVAD